MSENRGLVQSSMDVEKKKNKLKKKEEEKKMRMRERIKENTFVWMSKEKDLGKYVMCDLRRMSTYKVPHEVSIYIFLDWPRFLVFT